MSTVPIIQYRRRYKSILFAFLGGWNIRNNLLN